MDGLPIFSVIIPTYNREAILGRAIDSILNQSYTHFELIIVDDGSVDNTKKIVEAYKDSRIKYVYKENGGQNSALNKGLELAQGKYIAFCDSDDLWLPLKLEKTYEKYSADNSIDVVYCWTGIVRNGRLELAREDYLEGYVYKEVLTQGYLTSPTFLSCKKACFDKIGEFDLKVVNCQDDDLCFNLCKYFKVGLIKEILGIYYSDIGDRKSCMKRTAADSYLFLWEKHKEDTLNICGNNVYLDRLLKASYKYMIINDLDKAKSIYHRAKKYGKINIKNRVSWWLHYFKILK